jgi:ketosteroid isomerase-like protein
MSLLNAFGAYAEAFERAFASDDWSRLDAHFTEDAVYETLAAAPFANRTAGREAVKAHLRASVNGLDRRFDTRTLELLDGPAESGDRVWMRWAAVYTRAGAPDLRLEGEETAVFEGERIKRLEDRIPDAAVQRTLAYMTAHGSKLKPAP